MNWGNVDNFPSPCKGRYAGLSMKGISEYHPVCLVILRIIKQSTLNHEFIFIPPSKTENRPRCKSKIMSQIMKEFIYHTTSSGNLQGSRINQVTELDS